MSAPIQKALIVGGCGNLGTQFAKRLLDQGTHVRVAALRTRQSHPEMEAFTGDVTDPDHMRDAVRGCDYVFNMAAVFQSLEPARLKQTNENGPRVLAEACAKEGVKRFIHVSTAEIYGKPVLLPVKESSAIKPIGTYAKTKAKGEKQLEVVQKETGLPITVLRPTTLAGPSASHSIFWHWFETVRKQRPVNLIGVGNRHVQFVDIEDCISALLATINDPEQMGVYNIAGPDSITLSDACKLLYRTAGQEPLIRKLPAPNFGMGRTMLVSMRLEMLGTNILRADSDFVLDTRHASENLGWNPVMRMRDILVRSYKAHMEKATKPM